MFSNGKPSNNATFFVFTSPAFALVRHRVDYFLHSNSTLFRLRLQYFTPPPTSSSTMSTKKTKKELRKEATKRANRIHNNLTNANKCDNVLHAAPALAAFTSIRLNLPGNSEEKADTNANATIQFYKQALLPETILNSCLDLFEVNMGELYQNSSWGLNLAEKKEELSHENARFLIVSGSDQDDTININTSSSVDMEKNGNGNKTLAFAHFRFEVNDEDKPTEEVLYLYEIQIDSIAQRNGLGKRIMQIMEIIAMQQKMRKVLLTVFHNNKGAKTFYEKLKYTVDETSPSLFGEDADYEILSMVVYRGDD